jgi:hypothetical protein
MIQTLCDNRLRIGVLGVILAVAGGCGPTKVLSAPQAWPQQWRHLELYNTPAAYIYASSAASAGEADRVIRKVAAGIHGHGGDMIKGLVIVSASSDELAVSSPREMYRLTVQHGADAHATPVSDSELDARWEAIQVALDGDGIDHHTEMQIRSMAFDDGALTEHLGMPPDVAADVAWAVNIPTRRLIELGCRELMAQKIAQRGTGPLALVASAGFLVVEESRMVNNAAVNRNVVLFTEASVEQSAWSEAQRATYIQEYTQRMIDEAMFPVLSTLRDVVIALGETVTEPVRALSPSSDDGANP